MLIDKPGTVIEDQTFNETVQVRAEGVVMRRCTIHAPNGKALDLLGAQRFHFSGGEISGAGADGAASPANDLIYMIDSNDVYIADSIVRDAGRTHVLGRNSLNGIFIRNKFIRNESTIEQHGESFSLMGCHSTFILDNEFHGSQGTGCIMLEGDGYRINGNLIVHDATSTVGNGSIASWTPERDGRTHHVTNSIFVHNTIVNTRQGVIKVGIIIYTGIGNQCYHNAVIDADPEGDPCHAFMGTGDELIMRTGGNLFVGTFGAKSRYGLSRSEGTLQWFDLNYKPLYPIPINATLPKFGRETIGAFEYAAPVPVPAPPTLEERVKQIEEEWETRQATLQALLETDETLSSRFAILEGWVMANQGALKLHMDAINNQTLRIDALEARSLRIMDPRIVEAASGN